MVQSGESYIHLVNFQGLKFNYYQPTMTAQPMKATSSLRKFSSHAVYGLNWNSCKNDLRSEVFLSFCPSWLQMVRGLVRQVLGYTTNVYLREYVNRSGQKIDSVLRFEGAGDMYGSSSILCSSVLSAIEDGRINCTTDVRSCVVG